MKKWINIKDKKPEYGEVWYDGHDDYIAFEKIERWTEILEVG